MVGKAWYQICDFERRENPGAEGGVEIRQAE